MNPRRRFLILLLILVTFCTILYANLYSNKNQETVQESTKPLPTEINIVNVTDTTSATSCDKTTTGISKAETIETSTQKTNSADAQITSSKSETVSIPTTSAPLSINNTQVITSNNEVVSTQKQEQVEQNNNSQKTVTLRITGPDDIVILDATTIPIEDGDSVYTVLERALKEKGIALTTTGNKNNIYVSGIDKYFEFDFGPNSGFIYSVNDNTPSISSSKYFLDGYEHISWKYKK